MTQSTIAQGAWPRVLALLVLAVLTLAYAFALLFDVVG